MSKVVCIGECIVDMMPSKDGYIPNAGGAPCNVCACIAKLGGKGCYLGKLGGDEYADFLLEQIKSSGIDCRFVVQDKSLKTALAFVDVDENGDRRFTFFRDNTADLNLSGGDVPDDLLDKGDILHFCSLGLTGESEKAHEKAISVAKKAGAILSFDVNIRANLWKSLDDCVSKIKEFLPYADVVKVCEEELDALSFGATEKQKVQNLFLTATNCKILIVTKGKDGSVAYDRTLCKIVQKAYPSQVVNTTGAGDCFVGSILYLLAQNAVTLDLQSMRFALDCASRACAVQVSRNGSMTAMPTKSEIENLS